MPHESRVGRRRSTTPHHISDVAIELFAAHGFTDVSVDDIARAAGIARRTLFRYYASKNAIPGVTSAPTLHSYKVYSTISIHGFS